MFDKLRKWLRGEVICKRCGRTYNMMCFGYGKCICSDCYEKEDNEFIFLDQSYWLNRITT